MPGPSKEQIKKKLEEVFNRLENSDLEVKKRALETLIQGMFSKEVDISDFEDEILKQIKAAIVDPELKKHYIVTLTDGLQDGVISEKDSRFKKLISL